ncbi:hypothetical protein ACIGKQ_24680 [Gordonia sp. NPDC062954]|uniref:hypothetical protein n=1 Tax=Gordonia sp. NPDC062954 TaxID=3364003 RepID=UPI0037CB9020
MSRIDVLAWDVAAEYPISGRVRGGIREVAFSGEVAEWLVERDWQGYGDVAKCDGHEVI